MFQYASAQASPTGMRGAHDCPFIVAKQNGHAVRNLNRAHGATRARKSGVTGYFGFEAGQLYCISAMYLT
jgi:hypothetical protein